MNKDWTFDATVFEQDDSILIKLYKDGMYVGLSFNSLMTQGSVFVTTKDGVDTSFEVSEEVMTKLYRFFYKDVI